MLSEASFTLIGPQQAPASQQLIAAAVRQCCSGGLRCCLVSQDAALLAALDGLLWEDGDTPRFLSHEKGSQWRPGLRILLSDTPLAPAAGKAALVSMDSSIGEAEGFVAVHAFFSDTAGARERAREDYRRIQASGIKPKFTRLD